MRACSVVSDLCEFTDCSPPDSLSMGFPRQDTGVAVIFPSGPIGSSLYFYWQGNSSLLSYQVTQKGCIGLAKACT